MKELVYIFFDTAAQEADCVERRKEIPDTGVIQSCEACDGEYWVRHREEDDEETVAYRCAGGACGEDVLHLGV